MPVYQSFETFLAENGKMGLPKLLRYASDICEGLLYLFNNKIGHGDLKLSNLLYDPVCDKVIISDFGSSYGLDLLTSDGIYNPYRGNPAHLAPEIKHCRDLSVNNYAKQPTYELGTIILDLLWYSANAQYPTFHPLSCVDIMRMMGWHVGDPTGPWLKELIDQDPSVRPALPVAVECFKVLHEYTSHCNMPVTVPDTATCQIQSRVLPCPETKCAIINPLLNINLHESATSHGQVPTGVFEDIPRAQGLSCLSGEIGSQRGKKKKQNEIIVKTQHASQCVELIGTDTIKELKQQILSQFKILASPSEWVLIYASVLEESKTVQEYDIKVKSDSILHLFPQSPRGYQIFVRISRCKMISLCVEQLSVQQIKGIIAETQKIPAAQQLLKLRGTELKDPLTLPNGSVVNMEYSKYYESFAVLFHLLKSPGKLPPLIPITDKESFFSVHEWESPFRSNDRIKYLNFTFSCYITHVSPLQFLVKKSSLESTRRCLTSVIPDLSTINENQFRLKLSDIKQNKGKYLNLLAHSGKKRSCSQNSVPVKKAKRNDGQPGNPPAEGEQHQLNGENLDIPEESLGEIPGAPNTPSDFPPSVNSPGQEDIVPFQILPDIDFHPNFYNQDYNQ